MTPANTIESNAKLSISFAVEDFQSSDQRRTISALRNITAGILLTFKVKLAQLSPPDSNEVLIKKRSLPIRRDGKIEHIGHGSATVDANEIFDRFKSLGIKADVDRVKEIIELRNEIEHYRSDMGIGLMREIFAKAFFVLGDFCINELHRSPEEMFGEETWDVFVEEETSYEAIRKEINANNLRINWYPAELKNVAENFRCHECYSRLVEVVNPKAKRKALIFSCRQCAAQSTFDEMIDDALFITYAGENFVGVKDEGLGYTEECDTCLHEGYVPSMGHCVVCGSSPFVKCKGCGYTFRSGHYCENCDHLEDLEYQAQ